MRHCDQFIVLTPNLRWVGWPQTRATAECLALVERDEITRWSGEKFTHIVRVSFDVWSSPILSPAVLITPPTTFLKIRPDVSYGNATFNVKFDLPKWPLFTSSGPPVSVSNVFVILCLTTSIASSTSSDPNKIDPNFHHHPT